MRRDGVTADDVQRCLDSAERVLPAERGAQHHWKQSDLGWLRVTIVDEADRLVAVTVVVKQRGPVIEET
jgi:hypothetical protein